MQELAQITDLHIDDRQSKKYSVDARNNLLVVLDSIQQRGIKRLFISGDLAESGSLKWLKEVLQRFGFEYHVALGNHDSLDDLRANGLIQHNPTSDESLYYLIDNATIVLDSSSGLINAVQMNFLKESLLNAGGHALVFCHYPILDCGNSVMDRLYPLKNRQEVADLLLSSSMRIDLYCGHYHTTHDQEIRNVRQHVTPATSMQIKKDGDAIAIEKKGIGYRIIRTENGVCTDEVVMLKG